MRVLLIEDDSAVAQSIELMLKSESFNVYTTDLGEEGVDLGKLYDYDIILLDLNLPDMSGYDVLKQLRVSKIKTPILILSGLAGIEDKVKGLGVGADDYMTKPFHKDELVARIHAMGRRARGRGASGPARCGGRPGPAPSSGLTPAANGGVFVFRVSFGRPGARSRLRLLGDGHAFSYRFPTDLLMQRIRALKQSRPADRIAFRIADTDFSQRRKNALALDAFGDDSLAPHFAHLDAQCDHGAIDTSI